MKVTTNKQLLYYANHKFTMSVKKQYVHSGVEIHAFATTLSLWHATSATFSEKYCQFKIAKTQQL